MHVLLHLHASMTYVEMLADLLVLLRIFPPLLTSPGTILGGLAILSAVLEHGVVRCYGDTYDSGLGNDHCWSGVRVA
jgi:hypothetical protein